MERRKQSHRKKEEADASFLLLLRQCALGALLALALMLPLSLLLSLICCKAKDPLGWISTVGVALSLLSYFSCGILVSRKRPDLPLLAGGIGGILLALLFLLLGQIFSDEPLTFAGSILPKILGICVSVMGAFLIRIRQTSQKRIKMRTHGRR